MDAAICRRNRIQKRSPGFSVRQLPAALQSCLSTRRLRGSFKSSGRLPPAAIRRPYSRMDKAAGDGILHCLFPMNRKHFAMFLALVVLVSGVMVFRARNVELV